MIRLSIQKWVRTWGFRCLSVKRAKGFFFFWNQTSWYELSIWRLVNAIRYLSSRSLLSSHSQEEPGYRRPTFTQHHSFSYFLSFFQLRNRLPPGSSCAWYCGCTADENRIRGAWKGVRKSDLCCFRRWCSSSTQTSYRMLIRNVLFCKHAYKQFG